MTRWLSSPINVVAPLGVPMAWRQLTQDRKRFITAIMGVTFGFVLMLFQLGLYNASLRQVVFPHAALKGELVVTSQNFGYFYSNDTFPKNILYRLRGVEGISSVAPLNVEFVKWQNPTTGINKLIGALAVNPFQSPFNAPGLTNRLHLLVPPENVLFDRLSDKTDFGNIDEEFQEKGEVISQSKHVRLRVKGLFSMGQTLASTGHIIISDEGLARIYPHNSADKINVGLVSLRAGVDLEEARRRLEDFLPQDVRVITAREFQKKEQTYWITRTAIGFICVAGMLVGMFVGAIIVYQILYTDVTDHLREYATLKAIGVSDWFLFRIVMIEALILMIASFAPTIVMSGLLFYVTRTKVAMPTRLTVSEILIVFSLAAVVCVFSGLLATRKLKTADPADIF